MKYIVFYCEIHLKYCQDTIKRQFNSTMENNFAGKTACSLSYPGARVKIEKSFSPKLTDYFIQGVRKVLVSYINLYLQTDIVERFLQSLYQQMNHNPIWQGNYKIFSIELF